MSIGLKQCVELLGIPAQVSPVVLQTEILDVFIGIVQYGMEMAAQVHQIVVNGGQLLLQHAAHLTRGVGGGIGGVRFDEVDDGFRLGQIQLAVQESPLGKFTTACGFCSGDVQAFQSGSQNGRGTMTVKFYGVLAGVAMGGTGDQGAAGVDGAPLLVVKLAQHQLPVGSFGKGLLII